MENKITVDFKPIYATTQTISKHLKKFGIPTDLLGYQHLKHGIYAILNDNTLIYSITKRLYPIIAKECDTTPQRVERAIRHAIDVSFTRLYFDVQTAIVDEYFGNSLGADKGKPTNGQFLAAIAEKIKMDAYVAAESEAMKFGQM